jgi:glutamate-1-semialdehyde 2,1-aminomutase
MKLLHEPERFVPVAGLADDPVRDYEDAHAANHKAYASFFHGLIDRGVYVAPSGYEVLFPSLALGDAEIVHTLAAATEAVNALPR